MNDETNEVTPELERPKLGRPRKVSLDDDAGLLDSMLKVQIRIAEDSKANAATRERAAGEVRELIKQRATRRDNEAKNALTTEVTRLQGEVATLTELVKKLGEASVGKLDASEATALRQELNRLTSESQTHGARLSATEAERDRLLIALKYAVESLGSDASKTAMRILIGLGPRAKDILPTFGVDARAWLQMNAVYGTRSALLDVFRSRTADRETELTAYCRLRLHVEHGINDVEEYIKDEAQRRLQGETQHIKDAAFLNIERRLSI